LATQLTWQEIPRRFGSAGWLLPADEEAVPSRWERVRFVPYVIIPWLALYAFTSTFASHGTNFGMPL
jgi:hypothetical protein